MEKIFNVAICVYIASVLFYMCSMIRMQNILMDAYLEGLKARVEHSGKLIDQLENYDTLNTNTMD